MDVQKVKGGHRVTQSNILTEATYKTPFTLMEMRLLLTMVSLIQKGEKEFKPMTFSVAEFSKMIGLKEAKYTVIRTAMRDMVAKTIEFPDPDPNVNEDIVTNWFEEARYKHQSGQVTFTFKKSLMPHLLDLQNEFNTYKLGYVLILKSAYAIRLYELGKKWSGTRTGEFEYSLEELKSKLGIIDSDKKLSKTEKQMARPSYKTYSNFKMKVLVPSVKEITEKTDLDIEFEEIKEGRKVVAIRFKSKLKEKADSKKILGYKPSKKKITREELLPEWFDDYAAERDSRRD